MDSVVKYLEFMTPQHDVILVFMTIVRKDLKYWPFLSHFIRNNNFCVKNLYAEFFSRNFELFVSKYTAKSMLENHAPLLLSEDRVFLEKNTEFYFNGESVRKQNSSLYWTFPDGNFHPVFLSPC